jgi:hypothetical protein
MENATIEFLSHIRCEFEEDGFVEVLKKDKIRVLSKDSESKYIIKSEYFLSVPANDFIDILCDVKRVKEWDENIERVELILSLPDDTSVVYMKYKRFLVISSRDVVLVNRVQRVHNGVAFISASCEMDEFPVTSEAVRATIDVSGYYIEAADNGCRVIGYTVGDLGGKLPKAMVKAATSSALPRFIVSVEKYIKKRKSA